MKTFHLPGWPCSCGNVLDLTVEAEIDTDDLGQEWIEFYILCISFFDEQGNAVKKSNPYGRYFCPFCANDLTEDASLQESITNRIQEQC